MPDTMPCRETMRPDPQSPYGTSKLAAEHYVHTLGKLHGIETVVLRYFNVFGPARIRRPSTPRWCLASRWPSSKAAGRRSTAAARSRATSPTSTTSSRPTCWHRCRDRPERADLQRRVRRPAQPARPPGAIAQAAGRPADPEFGPARPATSGIRRRTSASRGRRSATRSSCRSRRASRRTVAWYPRPDRATRARLRMERPSPRGTGSWRAGRFFRGVHDRGRDRSGAAHRHPERSPIVTRLYSPSDYGAFAVAGSLLAVLIGDRLPALRAGDPAPKCDGGGRNVFVLCLVAVAAVSAASCRSCG